MARERTLLGHDQRGGGGGDGGDGDGAGAGDGSGSLAGRGIERRGRDLELINPNIHISVNPFLLPSFRKGFNAVVIASHFPVVNFVSRVFR